MYEVSKNYYTEFLPAVIEAAATRSPELEEKYGRRIAELLTHEEHRWMKGLDPKEAEALRKTYLERYNQ
jgi:hypothetical protein